MDWLGTVGLGLAATILLAQGVGSMLGGRGPLWAALPVAAVSPWVLTAVLLACAVPARLRRAGVVAALGVVLIALLTVGTGGLPRPAVSGGMVAVCGVALLLALELRRPLVPLAFAWTLVVSGLVAYALQGAGLGTALDGEVVPGLSPESQLVLTGLLLRTWALRAEDGPWRVLHRRTPGGTGARLALLLAVAVPLLVSTLTVAISTVPRVELALAIAGGIGTIQATQLLVAYTLADRLDHRDDARARALSDLRELVASLRAVADGTVEASALDASELVEWVARTARSLTGAAAARVDVDLGGESWTACDPPDWVDPPGVTSWYQVALPLGHRASGTLAAADARSAHAAELVALLATTLGALLEVTVATQRERAMARTREVLLDGFSHELRTPLTVVLGALLTLSRHADRLPDDVRADLLHRARDSAERLDQLLTDLVTLRAELAVEGVSDLAQVAGHVARARVPHDGEVVVDVSGPAPVALGPTAAQRLVEELVDNGWRHGGRVVRVACTTRQDGAVRLVVEDDGPGIPPAVRDLVVQPLWRGESVVTHQPGLGLGLTFVDRAVRSAGGVLRITAGATACGTRVEVVLPRAGHPFAIPSVAPDPQDPLP
ncbi:MAG: sensor histidine kinase [Actinomycetes bacterium]